MQILKLIIKYLFQDFCTARLEFDLLQSSISSTLLLRGLV